MHLIKYLKKNLNKKRNVKRIKCYSNIKVFKKSKITIHISVLFILLYFLKGESLALNVLYISF